MRKLLPLSLLVVFLLACSMSDLPLPGMAATPLPLTETFTPLPTSTFTPEVPPTFTSTPTLIGAKPTLPPSETPIPTDQILFITPATSTALPLLPTDTPTPRALGEGFLSMEQSTDLFHWGSCDPYLAKITVQMAEPERVVSVVLFFKFRNRGTGGETGWNQGFSLEDMGGGTYSITLDGRQMGMYDPQPNWVIFQIVATDKNTNEVARSLVFSQDLTLDKCP